MANAYAIADKSTSSLLVRVMNIDDVTQVAKNYDWTNMLIEEASGVDGVWDPSTESFTGSDLITFRTNNVDGYRSHGYQTWKYGVLVDEHVGGAAERRAPWPSGSYTVLHATKGEGGAPTAVGWRYELGFKMVP